MTFNANDPSGAGGLTADIASITSAGAHPLAVVTGAYVRDTAEIFDHFPFDACQLPLSGFDSHFRSFQKRVLPVLQKRGIAAIGMKSLNGTADAVKKGVIRAADAIRYAMSLPVAVTVSGIDSLEILRENLRTAREFTPMKADERLAFEKQCAAFAMDGRFELYKTTAKFEGPPGREQHGFPPQKEMAH